MIEFKRDSKAGLSLKAGIERGGCWLLIVLAGVVLMVALMSQQQKAQQLAIQQEVLALGLQTLQDSIAADISMGVAIEDNPRIEHMLALLLQSNSSLQSANVINQQGLIIYSTNRAQLHTQLPAQLLTLIHQQAKLDNWQLQWGNWWLLGMPINNAHAEEIGHIFLSAPPVTSQGLSKHGALFSTELAPSLVLSLLACVFIGAGIVFLLGVQARQDQHSFEPQLHDAMKAMRQARHQIQQGFDDLDRLEQKA